MDKKANGAQKESPGKDQSKVIAPPKEEEYNSDDDESSVIIFDSELLFIKDVKGVDVVFLVDTTGSMNPYMRSSKRFIRKICSDVRKTLSQYFIDDFDFVQYGLVTYRDHDQEKTSYVSKVDCDLTWKYPKLRSKVMEMQCKGGGDDPEAVADGLNDAVNAIRWRETSMKYIYHILDNPPHGTKYSEMNDSYAECPCQIKIEQVLKDLRGKLIYYTVVKLNENITKMIDVFSNSCKIDVMLGKMTPDELVPNTQTE